MLAAILVLGRRNYSAGRLECEQRILLGSEFDQIVTIDFRPRCDEFRLLS